MRYGAVKRRDDERICTPSILPRWPFTPPIADVSDDIDLAEFTIPAKAVSNRAFATVFLSAARRTALNIASSPPLGKRAALPPLNSQAYHARPNYRVAAASEEYDAPSGAPSGRSIGKVEPCRPTLRVRPVACDLSLPLPASPLNGSRSANNLSIDKDMRYHNSKYN